MSRSWRTHLPGVPGRCCDFSGRRCGDEQSQAGRQAQQGERGRGRGWTAACSRTGPAVMLDMPGAKRGETCAMHLGHCERDKLSAAALQLVHVRSVCKDFSASNTRSPQCPERLINLTPPAGGPPRHPPVSTAVLGTRLLSHRPQGCWLSPWRHRDAGTHSAAADWRRGGWSGWAAAVEERSRATETTGGSSQVFVSQPGKQEHSNTVGS